MKFNFDTSLESANLTDNRILCATITNVMSNFRKIILNCISPFSLTTIVLRLDTTDAARGAITGARVPVRPGPVTFSLVDDRIYLDNLLRSVSYAPVSGGKDTLLSGSCVPNPGSKLPQALSGTVIRQFQMFKRGNSENDLFKNEENCTFGKYSFRFFILLRPIIAELCVFSGREPF